MRDITAMINGQNIHNNNGNGFTKHGVLSLQYAQFGRLLLF
jgi:hypothetical protein